MPDPKAEINPRLIPILKNDKPCEANLQAFRVSNDGVLGALVLENGEIFIYNFIDSDGTLIIDKLAKRPKKVIIVTFGHLKKSIDLFIFKQRTDGPGALKYDMFLLFENGIVLI